MPDPPHQRIGRPRLKKIGHALAARCFMSEAGGRTPAHFAFGWCSRGLAIKAVEISTDELAVFHADAGVVTRPEGLI